MQIIKKLSEMISEEIADADKYATCALKYKDEDPALADTFYRLSGEEMEHMKMLHDQVVRIIEVYRRDHGEPPPEMLAVYNYLHEKHTEDASAVKAKHLLYKA